MKTSTVSYEKRNKSVSLVSSTIEYIAKSANTKQEAVNRLSEILPNELQIGFGGSHVWCANQNNERLFIIYF
jgi:hypothetical protein